MYTAPDLLDLWKTGVDAVRGDIAVANALAAQSVEPPDQIIAVGKAATAMARAAVALWPHAPCLIVTKDGHGGDAPPGARVIEAAHPVPNAASLTGGTALRNAVRGMGPDTHLLMLVSGGASALAECLPEGTTLADMQQQTEALLASGAAIGDMNALRTARSLIKGGKLLAGFAGAQVTTLALSDVEGDALMTIGSGIGAAPTPSPFRFDGRIIASNAIARTAIEAAAPTRVCRNAEVLYDNVDTLAPRLAQEVHTGPPGLYIYGGEPVVTLPENRGRGGRNMALALAMAREVAGMDGVDILVAGTDGTDGPTDAAGARVNGTTWEATGDEALAQADAYPWLDTRGALLRTGPTGTNVMDIVLVHKT